MLPLEGYRILSLTNYWAGPSTVRMLADMGAEAIKLEATKRLDPGRGPITAYRDRREYADDDPGDIPWERTPGYNERHLGSLGVALDLSHPKGKEIFLDLVRVSDAVVENFSARVMTSLGIDYAVLSQLKPSLVMLSMPGFGKNGPWKNFRSFGQTLEYLSGFASLTGYEEGQVIPPSIPIPDFMAALHGAAAVLLGLYQCKKTGVGQHIELAQLESTLSLMGDVLLHTAMTKQPAPPQGNRHPNFAPHGCFPAKAGSWITITVTDEDEWAGLCRIAKEEAWLTDMRFITMSSRKAHEQALNGLIGEWTVKWEKYHLTHVLQKAGVPAAPVLTAADHFGDPQVFARQMLVPVDHPSVGVRAYHDTTWRMSGVRPTPLKPAPMLGQHNRYVLETILGMNPQEVDVLEREGVIGSNPIVK